VSAPTLRADAQRNLGLILEAAAAEFAEKGHEASVAHIAERAGVGQATIFRRFETKDDLIAAVFERRIAEVVELARAAARKDSAWDGLAQLMARVAEMQIRDRGFFQANAERLLGDPEIQARKEEIRQEVAKLVRRAKAEGTLRKDITADDIPALSCAAAQAATMGPTVSLRALHRYLQVITSGMRA
jgi:AcrR family transcriptional regulator